MIPARILLVDDDKAIVENTRRYLEDAGYSVLSATDQLVALEQAQVHPVDLLLADLRMPGIDGFELAGRIREFRPDLAVVLMTGFGTVETAIQALRKGVDGLVLKPIDNGKELTELVGQVLASRREKQDAARLQILRPLFDVSENLFAETELAIVKSQAQGVLESFMRAKNGLICSKSDEQAEPVIIRSWGNADLREVIMPLTFGFSPDQWPNEPFVHLFSFDDPQFKKFELNSLMVVPAIRKQAILLFAVARETDQPAFTAADLDLFLILARQIALALENSRLYAEVKASVQKLEESQHALVQAGKMAALGRLVVSVAHEINNPLQSINNCLHLATRKDLPEELRFDSLEMAQSELERLGQVLRQMLDFYRPGELEWQTVKLQTILQRVLELLDAQFRYENVAVHTQYSVQPAYVRAIPSQLQQVFFNLLLNSLDAMREQTAEKQIWIEEWLDKQVVSLSIEDSGSGIPEKLDERIFEPFVTTKKHGTGLGLSISYRLVEAHSGILRTAQPLHGSGARLEVILPLRRMND